MIDPIMTEVEIAEERGYRNFERLGILCEDREPTLMQLFMAEQESDEWEQRYRKEHVLISQTINTQTQNEKKRRHQKTKN